MSSISAGTSSGTALVQSGDTTGALVIKTGGSAATAATFNADQSVTLAQPLPVASGGTGATSLSGITVGTATSATTATNLSGGSGGTIPYQTSSGATSMLAAGTSGYLLQSNGTSAPSWVAPTAPAGSVTAVASGALSDGAMVILNSDGTVSVASSSAGAGTQTIGLTASTTTVSYTQYMCVTASYNPTNSTIVVYYIRSSDGYLMGTAGIVTASSITFGTTTVIKSGDCKPNSSYGFGAVYVPSVSRHVVSYNQYDGQTYVKSLSTSGTVISLTSSEYYIFLFGTQGVRLLYDDTTQQVVAVGADIGNLVTTVCVMGVGASTFNPGSQVTAFGNSGSSTTVGITKDTVNNKIIVGGLNTSNYPCAAVGTISGNSISFGSATVIQSSAGNSYQYGFGLAYSPVYQKVAACFVTAASGYIQIAVGTVSGTSISFGTPVDSSAGRSSAIMGYTGIYDVASTKMVFVVSTRMIIVSSISGTVPTTTYYDGLDTAIAGYGTNAVYASNFYSLIVCGSNTSTGYASVQAATVYSSTLTSSNFLGVSNAAYSNGQTATIQTVGSTDDAQSGLTPGVKYYVSPSGSLTSTATSQPYAGLALTATKLVVKG